MDEIVSLHSLWIYCMSICLFVFLYLSSIFPSGQESTCLEFIFCLSIIPSVQSIYSHSGSGQHLSIICLWICHSVCLSFWVSVDILTRKLSLVTFPVYTHILGQDSTCPAFLCLSAWRSWVSDLAVLDYSHLKKKQDLIDLLMRWIEGLSGGKGRRG